MDTEPSANERRKAAKRDAIVAGAVKAFEQEGFERASMDLVAKLARASKGTVYKYFKSKNDLLWAVVKGLMAGQNELSQIRYSKDDSLESQLGRFVDAQVYFVVDPGRLSTARLLTSIFVQNKQLREEASNASHSQFDHLIEWVRAAKKDKRLKVKDHKLAAQVFHGLVEGTINFPALCGSLKMDRELKLMKDEVIAVFLSRYAP
jgi:AcrR family transcriptional regulator